MNWKTTLVLLVLTAAGGALLYFGPTLPARFGFPSLTAPSRAAVRSTLETELTPSKISRIEVMQGERSLVTLERGADGEWTLPGKWPARKAEAESLVRMIGGLKSRFAPEKAGASPAVPSFETSAITVLVRAEREYRLEFAEPTGEERNRFSRPTYVRVDGNEVLRLAPGLISALERPGDYYQQRRLFPMERLPRDPGSTEKVEVLAARGLTVEDAKGSGTVSLTKTGESWEVSLPVRDRTDPEKLRSLMMAVPDVWAEQFVPRPYKAPAEYGLDKPEQSITVTRASGPVTLLLGKTSPTIRERKETKPPPQGLPPGMNLPPQTVTVKEEYRYAKLKDNDQIFEVKADRLKDLFVPLKELRDARLARFRVEDTRKLVIRQGGQEIALAKENDRWSVEKPFKADAETTKVNDILDKLSGLSARDADVLDNPDLKAHGLDNPATVSTLLVTVEEEKTEGETKTKKPRTLTFALGKQDSDKKKLAIRVDDWARVNLVEDSLAALVKRPALAYRGRRVLDFTAADLDAVRVQRVGEAVALKKDKGEWKLTAPVTADADTSKTSSLVNLLSSLEATEFVNDKPEPKDLETYGLAKDTLSAVLTFSTDSKKPSQTLLLGKARSDKPGEFYGRLESSPSVFSIKKEVRDALDQGSLAFRPQQLWQATNEEVSSVRVKQAGKDEYRLTRKDATWEIGGPFSATAIPTLVEPLLTEVTAPRAERYEAHEAKARLAELGLDKPHLEIGVTVRVKKDPAPESKDKPVAKEETREHTLLVGKPTKEGGRYAKTREGEAVFVVAEKLVTAADHPALDLLDRKVLALDPGTIERVETTGAAPVTVQRKGDAWQVVKSPAPAAFPADRRTVEEVLGVWANLQALRYAAYGPKVDPVAFGLDKPEVTMTVTVQPPEKEGKKPPQASHTLVVGKRVDGAGGDRFARVDNGPGVIVLSAGAAADVSRTHLDFVDRTLVNIDPNGVNALLRKGTGPELEIRKKDEGWQVAKPAATRADDPTLDRLVDQVSQMRARKVAAYPAGDLARFGLDKPRATITLEGPKPPVTLKLGKPVEGATGDTPDCYVQAGTSDVIGVLPGSLAKQLLADPIKFRDRTVARFDDADRVILERGSRKAIFAKVDGTWKLTSPTDAEAEQGDLDDFVNALARLRADELAADKVGDKPPDLVGFGLDKPEVKWRLQLGTSDKLTLVVGKREPTSGRVFAKVEGKDVVFLLDQALTSRVLGEYRRRAPWTASPDPSQVESLRYAYANNPFTLEKVDTSWRVAGKPEAKVSNAAVTDTLAALDKLRVERFVADKGADPKLYGLAPPELVIEVKIPTGVKTLEVGRREGDSKRPYIRIAEKDRTDVFVISEADAARIIRDLAGFLDKGGEKPPIKP